MSGALFSLGTKSITPGAMEALGVAGPTIAELLHRHSTGDWGEVPAYDAQANWSAVRDGERIVSAYPLPDGGRVWVITEADRSRTTILLPSDY